MKGLKESVFLRRFAPERSQGERQTSRRQRPYTRLAPGQNRPSFGIDQHRRSGARGGRQGRQNGALKVGKLRQPPSG
ncbi:hypothetical protein, partial [Brevundimonas diminuta]|uniref:hypothetical protein n=1 Tax=Brevundimonas diminuta TaxID=293 RepID=UPI00058E5527